MPDPTLNQKRNFVNPSICQTILSFNNLMIRCIHTTPQLYLHILIGKVSNVTSGFGIRIFIYQWEKHLCTLKRNIFSPFLLRAFLLCLEQFFTPVIYACPMLIGISSGLVRHSCRKLSGRRDYRWDVVVGCWKWSLAPNLFSSLYT